MLAWLKKDGHGHQPRANRMLGTDAEGFGGAVGEAGAESTHCGETAMNGAPNDGWPPAKLQERSFRLARKYIEWKAKMRRVR